MLEALPILLLLGSVAPACDPSLLIARRPKLDADAAPSRAWWRAGDADDAVADLQSELETAVELPLAARTRTWALVIACSVRKSADPPRQLIVRLRQSKRLALLDAIDLGDPHLRIHAPRASLVDFDEDGSADLWLRGSVGLQQPERELVGEAELFVSFARRRGPTCIIDAPQLTSPELHAPCAATVVRVMSRARLLTRSDLDGTWWRFGIAARVHTAGGELVINERVELVADDAALTRWWSEVGADDVFERATRTRRLRLKTLEELAEYIPASASTSRPASAPRETRAVSQVSDTELAVLEGGRTLRKVSFPGAIIRLVRNPRDRFAAAFVVADDEDSAELYLIDVTTLAMRRFPRRCSSELTPLMWSPDGAQAVSNGVARAPLLVHSAADLESWVAGGPISRAEVRKPDDRASEQLRFHRWTSATRFELIDFERGVAVHYRHDVSTGRTTRLYARALPTIDLFDRASE